MALLTIIKNKRKSKKMSKKMFRRNYLQLKQYIDLLTDAFNADESIEGRLKLAKEVLKANEKWVNKFILLID